MDLRALIVDDEQLARDELCFLLEGLGGVTVLGQAGNGLEAIRLVDELRPDLVLLDVQMPGLTGFEVARRLLRGDMETQVVFVTAYDQYAIEAFKVNAVDYLLKPIEARRLAEAVERVRRRIPFDRVHSGGARHAVPLQEEDLERIVQHLAERQNRRERLAVKVGERFMLVQAEDVIYASLVEDAITVVTATVTGTCSYRTLDDLQAHLDPAVFWRVHRSHLVNINKIKEIVPWFSRNYILKMKDARSTEIPVSRAQTRRLREYLQL
jgi:two-component system, LytTR family, response regulator LytT